MTRLFYTHIIEIEFLLSSLDELNLTDEQKKHLAYLVDSSLHHTILDAIYSELSDSDKVIFTTMLKNNVEKEELLTFLNSKIDNVEGKIKKVAKDLTVELHKDVKESQRIKDGGKS